MQSGESGAAAVLPGKISSAECDVQRLAAQETLDLLAV
jgi:hypothetical protein